MPYSEVWVDNSALGASDTLSSGAPATLRSNSALSNCTAAITAASNVVTFTAPDAATAAAAVAALGSSTSRELLFVNDATTNARNFAWYVPSSGIAYTGGASTFTITCQTGLNFSNTISGLSWAVGGKRSTLFGTATKKMLNNNGASDLLPGTQIVGQCVRIVVGNAHTEAVAAALALELDGTFTTTTGGTQHQITSDTYSSTPSGLSSRPTFTISLANNTSFLTDTVAHNDGLTIMGIDFVKASGTGGTCILLNSRARVIDCRVLVTGSANWQDSITIGQGGRGARIQRCTLIGHTRNGATQSAVACRMDGNIISGGTNGILISQASNWEYIITDNQIYNASTAGIALRSATATGGLYQASPGLIARNSILNGATATGILIDGPGSLDAAEYLFTNAMIVDNRIERGSVGLSINVSTSALLEGLDVLILNNNTGAAASAPTTRYSANCAALAQGDPQQAIGLAWNGAGLDNAYGFQMGGSERQMR